MKRFNPPKKVVRFYSDPQFCSGESWGGGGAGAAVGMMNEFAIHQRGCHSRRRVV